MYGLVDLLDFLPGESQRESVDIFFQVLDFAAADDGEDVGCLV